MSRPERKVITAILEQYHPDFAPLSVDLWAVIRELDERLAYLEALDRVYSAAEGDVKLTGL